MTVQDIMTTNVQTCTPTTTLPQVVRLMREAGCGIIPVIDTRGQVSGVVTDRDISMALVATSRKPANVAVHEIMSGPVHACGPGDDLRSALAAMRQFRVRRLPVISADGRLEGIVSMDDFILRAVASDGPTSIEIIAAMREILKPAGEPLLVADVSDQALATGTAGGRR
jgi:CBS domain-containing protein